MPKKNGSSVDLAGFFGVADMICHAPQQDRDSLIRALVYRLAGNYREVGGAEAIFASVVEREEAGPTLLAPGLAMPHARISGISRPYIAVATSDAGVSFDPDQLPAHVVILLLVPIEQPALYLQILHSLSTVIHEQAKNAAISRLETAEEIMRFFQRGGLILPDHLCAADIMAEELVTLKENDSLKTAIDLFVDRALTEVPVVDKDGDLVGVVSAGALLHVCLPDYLLWMDDLSPISNFEPFATVLRNEANTWLGEILSETYAFVQVESPAISVAAEMQRRNTSRCYVLKGRHLMGVITLQRFLSKLFRE